MLPTSYWTATAPRFAAASPRLPSTRLDVAIVGAGLTGLAAARALARRGARVAVLEAGAVAGEASGRNGGHCNNGLSQDFATIAARFGLERACEMYRAYDAAVDLVEAIAHDDGIDCDFRRSGKLKLAARPAHADALARAQEALARHVDADTAFLSRDDLAAEIGSGAYFGGLLQRRSASLHVGRFAVGLADSAARAGATIHEGAAVMRIDRAAGHPFSIITTQGVVEASDVLLATGASQHGPFDWQRRRIAPIGSFVIVTEPLSDAHATSIMPGRRNCTTSQHIGNYFRMTADNRLVFGGRARFARSNPASDIKSGAILQDTMRRVFPQIAAARIAHCWGGLVDMTLDRLPRAGSHEGVHFAMGYSGHGVQMSTYMGDLMGRRLAGEDVVNPWRDIDWPTVPLHAAKAWLLPVVGLYYRALDRIG